MTCFVTEVLLRQLVIFALLLSHCLREGLLICFVHNMVHNVRECK